MKKLFTIVAILTVGLVGAQVKLGYNDDTTPTYDEVIAEYQKMADKYANASLLPMGATDSGRDLHLFVIGGDMLQTAEDLPLAIKNKVVVLINNGIHPGESCGIDASLEFAYDLLIKPHSEEVVYAIIPVYNIGGSLNRGSYSRANQMGPKEHGFRGNARNLDLNRDFIKGDSKNTYSFYRIFQLLQPHIFIDTHTSNGADYQYTMTLISTQKDKLNPVVSELMTNEIEPYLYKNMEMRGWEMTPYVNVFGYTPEKGFDAFLETPRYASGYTALFNTIGFITETHMLKPYADRVQSTLAFLKILAQYTEANTARLKAARVEAFKADSVAASFDLAWAISENEFRTITFKGYEYEYTPSQIGDYRRLKYLTDKPKTYEVKYRDKYISSTSAEVPQYYVVPQAWGEAIANLKANGVQLKKMNRDTVLEVTSYYIKDAEFVKQPYEGHFLMTNLKTEKTRQKRTFLKGDYLINTRQKNIRFIMAVLEPIAVDSYLRWNYFDEIFQQKEYFSAYVFEDTAHKLLAEDDALRERFEQWKKENPAKAKDVNTALYYIYTQSPYYEKEHLRYPVARIE